jgi:hypothetical protein
LGHLRHEGAAFALWATLFNDTHVPPLERIEWNLASPQAKARVWQRRRLDWW